MACGAPGGPGVADRSFGRWFPVRSGFSAAGGHLLASVRPSVEVMGLPCVEAAAAGVVDIVDENNVRAFAGSASSRVGLCLPVCCHGESLMPGHSTARLPSQTVAMPPHMVGPGHIV